MHTSPTTTRPTANTTANTTATTTRKAHHAGTHRTVAPEETLKRITPLLPAMGITRVANVTGLDRVGIPVVMVTRPNSRSVSVSQGKGTTLTAAKVSGIMEAIEGYHAERVLLPLKFASFEELRYTHQVVNVYALPRVGCSTFTPHTPLLWTEGRSLVTGQPVWVPFETVHLNYVSPMPTGSGCFIASSNGLSSGNTLEEAISHGISEVVERDAATLWHRMDADARAKTRVDLATVLDGWCCDLIKRFDAAGIDIGIWDITSDIGLPAILCRAVPRDGTVHGFRPAVGMGCHPAPEIALSRALTEAAQSRLTFISGARDDMPRSEYEHFLDAGVHKRWQSMLHDETPQRSFQDVGGLATESISADIRREVTRVMECGGEDVIVVDLTKTEFGIPVVRVIIPGLEGIDHSSEYVPGRRALGRATNDSAVIRSMPAAGRAA